MREIRVLESAVGDIEVGREFYHRLNPGVGDYFTDTIVSEIESLLLFAGIHPIVYGFHRMLSRRFPYAIYYRLDDEYILVFRVLDCRAAPDLNAGKLKNYV